MRADAGPGIDGKTLNLITHIPAGRSLSALVSLLTEVVPTEVAQAAGDPWPAILRAAEQVSETALRVSLAFFAGPCGDHGEIANIREDNLTVGHLFRAAFQNMADNYHACALRLSPQRQWNRLVFSGGLAQKIDLLRRMICDKFGADYRLSPSSEDSILGLLALALTFSGRAPSVQQAMVELANRYRDDD